MKSMCQDARRNSPSVADCSPMSSWRATTVWIASSSTSCSCPASMIPAANSSRAASRRGGRSRLPTWSARKGGELRIGAIVAAPARAGQGPARGRGGSALVVAVGAGQGLVQDGQALLGLRLGDRARGQHVQAVVVGERQQAAGLAVGGELVHGRRGAAVGGQR